MAGKSKFIQSCYHYLFFLGKQNDISLNWRPWNRNYDVWTYYKQIIKIYSPFFLWTERGQQKGKSWQDIFKLKGGHEGCVLKINCFWGKKSASELFLGENIFLLLQYQKTSKKKYVSIYLLFHICWHGFGGFLNFSCSLLCLLISYNSFPIRQKLTVLINCLYWISKLVH